MHPLAKSLKQGFIVSIICGLITTTIIWLLNVMTNQPDSTVIFGVVFVISGFAYLIVGWPIASFIKYLSNRFYVHIILHVLFGSVSIFLYVLILKQDFSALMDTSNYNWKGFILYGSIFSLLYYFVDRFLSRPILK